MLETLFFQNTLFNSYSLIKRNQCIIHNVNFIMDKSKSNKKLFMSRCIYVIVD